MSETFEKEAGLSDELGEHQTSKDEAGEPSHFEGSMTIREEFFLASNIRISSLIKTGVAEGRSDIKEPKTQHIPNLINMEEYEDWMSEAASRGRKLDRQKKTFVGESIDLEHILDVVTTADGEVKTCRHALILGAAGMGKSTLLFRIADRARRGQLENLKGKLIIMPDFRTVSPTEKISPWQALIGNMFTDRDSDRMEKRYRWLIENSADVVFIVDSLDTLPFDLENERARIGKFEEATVDVIVHNLLAGDLFPKSSVISSSREYKVRNLHPSVRPGRCILLDGLKDDSVRDLIDGFLGEREGAEVKEHIDMECPDAWPLLSIPVFLVLAVIGFAQRKGFKPKTMAGILVKFLLSLIQSQHARVRNIRYVLRNLMPLSFEGIRNGRVLFTPEDLERHGLKPDQVTDLTILIPQSGGSFLSSKLIQKDRFYLYFNHQTIQECIAAFHVLSMTKEEFRNFVVREMQEAKFGVVRRLVCGILLNEEVLAASAMLVKVKDAEEKKVILLENYSEALKREQGREWDEKSREKLLELLIDVNEGKNGANELIRSTVQRISLRRVPLRPSDIQAVASVMKQCDHLKDLNLRICKLNAKKMEILTTTVLQSNLKIDKLDISENDLGEAGALQVAKLSKHCEVKSLRARECMDSGCLKALVDGATGMKIIKLDVGKNRSMGIGGMLHLGKFVNTSEVEDLDIRMSDLGPKHMQKFAEGVGRPKLKKLNVNSNEELGPDGMLTLGQLVGNSEIEDLEAEVCDIGPEHAEKLTEGIGSGKLRRLNVSWNRRIGSEGLYHLGRLVKTSQPEELEARMCNIDFQQLKKFYDGAENAKLRKLDVSDNRGLGPDGMHLLGELASDFEIRELTATACCHTRDVKKLIEGLGNAKLDHLNLANMWEPLYTPALLDLLPHVEKELNLQHWFISDNQRDDLQRKLDECGAQTLTIKLGTKKRPILLVATTPVPKEEDLPSNEGFASSENKSLLPTSFIETEKRISSVDGGEISLDHCRVKLPPSSLKKDGNIRITVEIGAPSDTPENVLPISPILGCDLSQVELVPGYELEVEIRAYCFSSGEPVPVILFCKESDSDVWKEERELKLGRDRNLLFETSTFSWRWYGIKRSAYELLGLGWLLKFPVVPHLYYDKFGTFKSYLCVDDQQIIDDLKSKHNSAGFKSALVMPGHMIARLSDQISVIMECINPRLSSFGDNDKFTILSDELLDKIYANWDFPLLDAPGETTRGFIEVHMTMEKGIPPSETKPMRCRVEWPIISDKDLQRNLDGRREPPRNVTFNIGTVNAEKFVAYSEGKKEN